ncbi:hypothetical protein B6A14_00695 [Polynucleobacter hirudinilacicola]|uniref:C4-dicarboxylate ABC transporter substrate-binding protein n=1 Tax=Polynucleobacter hirudinilacicola TaxID=1743166 RepID=A0A210RZU8_9BURK|nr:TAXI family TRAP transporter solute-binding subunit [Polynucleobacter hirudinilacicola]OWF66535.1 hypothetical protein B6A14_00695 [Polynucleobacter hirudinilacicola]
MIDFQLSLHTRIGRRNVAVVIASIFLLLTCLIGVSTYYLFPKTNIVIAAGPKGSYLYDLAQSYADELQKKGGVKAEIIETSGVLENLALLNDASKNIDFGILQGGIANPKDSPDLFSLGSIFYDPIWIVYRAGLGEIDQLNQLKGKRIAIGTKQDSSQLIAKKLFKSASLDSSNVTFEDKDVQSAVKGLLDSNLDALVFLAPPEDLVLKEIFNNPSLRVMNMSQSEGIHRNLRSFTVISLPFATVDLSTSKPATNMKVMATTVTIATRIDVHPALIYLMMGVMDRIHESPSLISNENEFPADKDVDLPLSPTAEAYYKNGKPFLQHYLPFWLASFVEKMIFLLVSTAAIAYPLLSIYPAYQWMINRQIDRLYKKLHALERELFLGKIDQSIFNEKLTQLDEKANALLGHFDMPLAFYHRLYTIRDHIRKVLRWTGKADAHSGASLDE